MHWLVAYEGYRQNLDRPDDHEAAAQDFERMHSKLLPHEDPAYS